jgi:hypothetical protein
MAVALAAPAMAQQGMVGTNGVDILGQGIFETQGNAFKFPADADTNYDSVEVGNDFALAMGVGSFPFPVGNVGAAAATNNLKIKKNQDSGECACCQALDPSCPCKDCCTKYNVEQIKVGSRKAMAFGVGGGLFNTGAAAATNNVEIVTNQQ